MIAVCAKGAKCGVAGCGDGVRVVACRYGVGAGDSSERPPRTWTASGSLTRAVGTSGMTVTMTFSSGEAAAGGACRGGCAVCAAISKVSMLVRAVCAVCCVSCAGCSDGGPSTGEVSEGGLGGRLVGHVSSAGAFFAAERPDVVPTSSVEGGDDGTRRGFLRGEGLLDGAPSIGGRSGCNSGIKKLKD